MDKHLLSNNTSTCRGNTAAMVSSGLREIIIVKRGKIQDTWFRCYRLMLATSIENNY